MDSRFRGNDKSEKARMTTGGRLVIFGLDPKIQEYIRTSYPERAVPYRII